MHKKEASFLTVSPLVVFIGLFFLSTIYSVAPVSPLLICLIAIIYSFFTFPSSYSLNKKIEIFIQGTARPIVITMSYIFVLSAIFTHTLTLIGSIDSAVTLGLYFIPTSFLLPGFFILVSLFATAIGSSMGAIATFMPIGIGIAHKLSVDPALATGIIVNGALFGDNLSIISDTTIAAVQTTGCTMKAKFIENLKLALPAAALTIITLFYHTQYISYQNALALTDAPAVIDFVNIIPYLLVFIIALCGFHVIAVLMIGIIAAVILGISQHILSIGDISDLIVNGFINNSSSIEVTMLVLLIAGLSYIIEYNGGVAYILDRMHKTIRNSASAMMHIASMVFVINAALAINTITILITGPVASTIGDKWGIKSSRIAALIDIVACISQGILPYAPQLLLAASLAHISSLSILPTLYYQWYSLLLLLIYIGYEYLNNKDF